MRIFKRTTEVEHAKRYLTSLPVESGFDLKFAGSPYGGWVFAHSSDLWDCVVVAAGAGEDISFEVELSSLYQAKIVLIDPTPRAVSHVNDVIQRVGSPRSEAYSITGVQLPGAYDLSRVSRENFVYRDSALAKADGVVDFFPPANPSAVSHSLSRKKGNTAGSAQPLYVQAESPNTLRRHLSDPDSVTMVKLDIEGAELEVIPGILEAFPSMTQLLMECDALKLEEFSFAEMSEAIDTVCKSGLVLAHKRGRNLTFARPELKKQ